MATGGWIDLFSWAGGATISCNRLRAHLAAKLRAANWDGLRLVVLAAPNRKIFHYPQHRARQKISSKTTTTTLHVDSPGCVRGPLVFVVEDDLGRNQRHKCAHNVQVRFHG